MNLQAVKSALATLDVALYIGYPATGATAPYITLRPYLVDPIESALSGAAVYWDDRLVAYTTGASVEASYNLALSVVRLLHGTRIDEAIASCSIGYVGLKVEGLYDSQVVIQANQGGI